MRVRTTIDLPDDLHRIARALARDEGRTLSETVALLLRRALGEVGPVARSRDDRTGLPTVRLGAPVTTEDVRALDDEL